MTMEIYTALKSDHQEVKKVLKTLEATTEKSGKRRQHLLLRLKTLLVPHSRAEERVLYERLKESDVKHAAALAFEGYEEHAVVDHLMEQLEATSPADKKWTALMAVVKENLEHHIDEEENAIFKKARQAFDRETAVAMCAAFQRLKVGYLAEVKAGKTPAQPPSHEIVQLAARKAA